MEGNTGKETGQTYAKPLPNIIHNFSFYKLSEKERKELAHSLNRYIPDRIIYERKLEVELEHLYKNILWNAANIGEEEKQRLKTKILSCTISTIKTPYQYKETVNKLSKNENICLLKQEKGRGIVIVDRMIMWRSALAYFKPSNSQNSLKTKQ